MAKNDITFEYSNVKRNSNDEITDISIVLIEKKKGSMESISWLFERKENVISDIFVGRRNGILVIMDEKVKEKKIEPKMFGLDNGDQIIFFEGNKLKVPGHPSVMLEKTSILVNGKKAEPSIFKTVSRISSLELIYQNNEEKSGLKTVKITTP